MNTTTDTPPSPIHMKGDFVLTGKGITVEVHIDKDIQHALTDAGNAIAMKLGGVPLPTGNPNDHTVAIAARILLNHVPMGMLHDFAGQLDPVGYEALTHLLGALGLAPLPTPTVP